MPKIRILVVDDSVVVRRMVSNILESDPELEVVGVAANGRIAIAKIPQVHPDTIVLDVEMPDMNGLETLAAIRQQNLHLPIIMFSAVTERGATATLEALSLGATDYVTKPHNLKSKEEARRHIQEQLIPKIKVLSRKEKAKSDSRAFDPAFPHVGPTLSQNGSAAIGSIAADGLLGCDRNYPSVAAPIYPKSKVEIVAIGVSTGGPNALEAVLSQLPANFPVPIAIVQHMPPVFTKRLAERLAQKCKIRIEEGRTLGTIEPGLAWIAPGDYHMVVEKGSQGVQLRLNQEPLENSCRPAVDVLFRSIAKTYGTGALAVILTGMGQDGLNGCQCIREAGGRIIVQDEATSVVWGMPGMVANAGLAEGIVPLHDIAREILRRV